MKMAQEMASKGSDCIKIRKGSNIQRDGYDSGAGASPGG